MKIFYDHQIFSMQNYGGASRLFAELIDNINSCAGHEALLSLVASGNIHLKEKGIQKDLFRGVPFLGKSRGAAYKINSIYNKIDFLRRNVDIYHPTYYADFLMHIAKRTPTVVTFLDMIHEKFHHKFKGLRLDSRVIGQKKSMIDRATHLIAISESTKNDIIDIYNVNPDKISVVYLGSSFQRTPDPGTNNINKPYFLFVGNRGDYKNFTKMLQAIAPLMIKHDIDLICAGGKALGMSEIEEASRLKLTGRLHYREINDSELSILYSRALAFIFPSLYEGFGIPVLEAFACGCPCILSDTSSLPEVAGDAAIYFDPYDEDSIQSSVEKMLLDSQFRNSIIEKGYERERQFSWKKNAVQTLGVYNLVI